MIGATEGECRVDRATRGLSPPGIGDVRCLCPSGPAH